MNAQDHPELYFFSSDAGDTLYLWFSFHPQLSQTLEGRLHI